MDHYTGFATELFLGSLKYSCSLPNHKNLQNDSTLIPKVNTYHLKSTIIRTMFMFYEIKDNFITRFDFEWLSQNYPLKLDWKKNLDLFIFISWFQKKLFLLFRYYYQALVSSKHTHFWFIMTTYIYHHWLWKLKKKRNSKSSNHTNLRTISKDPSKGITI